MRGDHRLELRSLPQVKLPSIYPLVPGYLEQPVHEGGPGVGGDDAAGQPAAAQPTETEAGVSTGGQRTGWARDTRHSIASVGQRRELRSQHQLN